MTIVLTLENGTTTTTNVSKTFTNEMINDCFLNKDFKSFGIVVKCEKSNVTVY